MSFSAVSFSAVSFSPMSFCYISGENGVCRDGCGGCRDGLGCVLLGGGVYGCNNFIRDCSLNMGGGRRRISSNFLRKDEWPPFQTL